MSNASSYKAGDQIKCDIFQSGDMVDVSGLTRGRGSTGTIQRWNASRLRMSYGAGPIVQSMGSTGAAARRAGFFKNKSMPKQYGHEKVTIQNLEVVKVDPRKKHFADKGSVPALKGGLIAVRQAVKCAK